VRYTLIAVVAVNVVSLALAILINRLASFIAGLLRTVFFLPNMLGGLALGYIFQFVFQIVFTDIIFGPESFLHIEALRYMTQDSVKALFALALLSTWQSAGYMMLIYIAGLNAIPQDYYEAASIDGSTGFHTFRKITIPMLMPSFTVVFFMTLSGGFKLLDQNVALTDGAFDTRMLAYQILRTIRDSNPPEYGKAQAQAVIFFIIVAVISLTQVYLTKKKELEA
jgi:raffinose/stachyose/melibiose transport system permease protein